MQFHSRHPSLRFLSGLVALLGWLDFAPLSVAGLVDDFSDPAAWRSIGEAPAPQSTKGGGLSFTLPFADGRDRVYWDRDGTWDFKGANAFELELSCDQPAAMRSLAIYFRSGAGWYIWSQPLAAAGRQKLTLAKKDFQTEGTPNGWDKIDKIRISPWKGQTINTALVVHQLGTRSDRLYLIQATTSAPNNTERALAKRTTERLSRWLTNSGIGHAIVTEDQLPQVARQASLIVLPYNPQVSAAGIKALQTYAGRGGKMVVFYSSSDALAKLMGVRLGAATNTRDIARWRGMAFTKDALPGVPPVVHQQSWSIGPAQPVAKGDRVIAWWIDAAGKKSADPAVISTTRGFWFTHILLDDDTLAKERMLTGVLAHLEPSIWRETADYARLNAGRVDGWRDVTDATRVLSALATGHRDTETIEAFKRRILQQHGTLIEFMRNDRHRDATLKGYELTDTIIRAYGLAQRPVAGEFRAVWDHDATGWYPGDWDRTAKLMADSGINALFVNCTWAGLAHYPSKLIPGSFTLERYGDQLAQAIRAAKKYGIEVHAWIVCWTLENSRAEFTGPLKKTDRMQRSANGTERLWMNPAHPANRKHHLDLISEILSNYDVDGIHLDYIRYPDSDACFSTYTRQQFTKDTGVDIAEWPEEVQPGGRHRDTFVQWRAGVISSFVRETRDHVKKLKPGVKLSAAVWGGYPQTINSIGQDWAAWMKSGLLDFVTPMNYANDLYRFTALVDQQLALPGVRGKIYPGIGVTANESQLRGDQVVEQVLALRQRGVKGFALFDLSQTLVDDTLPTLRTGVTRK